MVLGQVGVVRSGGEMCDGIYHVLSIYSIGSWAITSVRRGLMFYTMEKMDRHRRNKVPR